MKPPIYGYLRRLPEVDDATEAHLIANMAAYTEAEGFTLALVFIERRWQSARALAAVMQCCLADNVRHVVVPSSAHLNTLPFLSIVAREELQAAIGGRVRIVASESEEFPCPPTPTSNGGQQ